MGSLLGVRKGAWIEEEDLLLRKCIQKYGEGRWHQVPLRAGLNRCRKSCRLRWLNYLRPNIKRGEFTTDEVDLIIRLHKLLGNRWSLIAGRLPGRTANDVKNYWHTHLHKKNPSCGKKTTIANAEKAWSTNVIKPQPRTFSKTSPWLKGVAKTIETTQSEEDSLIEKPTWISPEENTVAWWEAMLAENDGTQCCINESGSVLSGSSLGHEPGQVQHRVPPIKVGDPSEEEQNHWDEFCFDVNFWTWVAS